MQKKNMENSIDKLLPCPFCGGEARIEKDESGHNSVVICFGCFINDEYNMWYQTKQEAIKAWNHRHAKPVSKEDLIKVIKKNWLRYNLKDYWSNDTIIESEAEAIINKYSVHERNE